MCSSHHPVTHVVLGKYEDLKTSSLAYQAYGSIVYKISKLLPIPVWMALVEVFI